MEECSATVVIQEAPKFDYNEKQQVQGVGVGDKCVVIHTDESDGSTAIAIFKLELEDCVENSTDKAQLCFNLNKEAGDLMCSLVHPHTVGGLCRRAETQCKAYTTPHSTQGVTLEEIR
ncbi:hypothetical protein Pmani_008310 [Petrolisthes manimaculis]|uniref:Uncharacterized protein n=1 Tax=Petrolisthes manimaculis TaxID=1843537 RepID=A0AAE1UJ43_9EUCA|nr:hypothetical protein Pmani_008310 [Petrolisthes manimaculis]